jgi:hypothetical protein
MLGQYVHIYSQAQQAINRLTGMYSTCTGEPSGPLLYCQAGQIVGYALDAHLAGQKQTLYFDANWQPLTAAPTNAQPCCKDKKPC